MMLCPVCGTENATCVPPGYVSLFAEDEMKAKMADKATVQGPDKSRTSLANKATAKRTDKLRLKSENKSA